ncbi:Stp1/IreP family PP2C-type Ser/Thr phosphatase [Lactobacillus sp. M0345]|nr:Stp1/IreP family PP2C-type Ser/Thr phosphatase [Lactobacillus sp. M0345]
MEVAANSVIGKQRISNEDYVGYFKNQQGALIAILADGVGGSNGGEIAASTAVDFIGQAFQNHHISSIIDTKAWLSQTISNVNNKIVEMGIKDESLSKMATTVVVALFFGNQYLLTHLGDSRCYLLRSSQLKQLTVDHSYINFLIEKGEVRDGENIDSNLQNVIVKGLGVSSDADVDISNIQFRPGDQLLLCSDGLTKMVSDETISKILNMRLSGKQKVDRLIDTANDNGGKDNISAILIDDLG